MAQRLNIETDRVGQTLRVRLIGSLDREQVDLVDELLRYAQRDSKNDSVVLDLRGVTFIDSSGVKALVSAALRAAKVGDRFRLIRGPHNVHRVFELIGLDGRLDFLDGDETGDLSA